MPEPIEIYFLGTGGGTPFSYRRFPCICIRYPPYVIFFDFGEGCQFSLIHSNIHPFRYNIIILISHFHADHTSGIPGFFHTLRLIDYEHKVTIVGPKGLRRFVKNIAEAFLIGFYGIEIDLIEIEKINEIKKILDKENFEIYAFPTEHSVESIGYIFQEKPTYKFDEEKAKKLGIPRSSIRKKLLKEGEIVIGGRKIRREEVISKTIPGRKIVYTGDTLPNETIVKAAKNADLLIHEANYMDTEEEEAIARKHSTVTMALQVAEKANVKTIALVHISSRYKNNTQIKNQIQTKKHKYRIIIPNDGEKIKI